jgi:subtilisin family serine protease
LENAGAEISTDGEETLSESETITDALPARGLLKGGESVQSRRQEILGKNEKAVRVERVLKSRLTAAEVAVVDELETPADAENGETTQLFAVETDDAARTLEEISALPEVAFAEPNFQIQAFDFDPGITYQWALNPASAYGVNVEPAWAVTEGAATVTVGVIDTGVQTAHPDLAAGIESGGYDFVHNDSNVYDDAIEDKHGTHVAGIIGRGRTAPA